MFTEEMKRQRRQRWTELNASWNVDPKQGVSFETEEDFKCAQKMLWDPESPLYNCPRELLPGGTGAGSIGLPELAIPILKVKGLKFQIHPIVAYDPQVHGPTQGIR